MDPGTWALIFKGLGAAGAVAGAVYSGKAAQAGKEGLQAQKRTQALETRRTRMAARREARQARAQSIAGATAQGAGAGSAAAGAAGSVISRAAAGEAYLGQAGELSTQYFDAKIRETIFAGSAATFGALGQLGFGLATEAGGFKGYKEGRATTGAGSKGGMKWWDIK